MMTDGELDALRKMADWMREDALPGEALLTEANLRKIFAAAHSVGRLLAHVDEQASQIATLKAALIDEKSMSVDWQYGEKRSRTDIAKEQLAQEYPDIFKEE